MKAVLLLLFFVFGSILNFAARNPFMNSAPVSWYDVNTHKRITYCTAHYYVENDIFYIDQEFKSLSFSYEYTKTKKSTLRMEYLPFHHNQKKGKYWYVKFYPGCVKKQHQDSYLSKIILRCCLTPDKRNTSKVAPDAYLYNVSSDLTYDKGAQVLNDNLKKIYKYVKQR